MNSKVSFKWPSILGTIAQFCTVTSKAEEVKIVAFCVWRFRSEFKRTGKIVGVILKPFKIFPLSFFFFFWHIHIRPCGCRSNPLLCQSSCSALVWKHSETACFHCSRGKAGTVFQVPLTLQMCLDQGKLTMCFVFFRTLMWLCHIFSTDSQCY